MKLRYLDRCLKGSCCQMLPKLVQDRQESLGVKIEKKCKIYTFKFVQNLKHVTLFNNQGKSSDHIIFNICDFYGYTFLA